MDQRSERVQRLTKDILDLFQEAPAEPATYLKCPNCSHRIGLIVESGARTGRRGRKPGSAAGIAAVPKQRKPPKIGPVLKLVRKMASQQRVVTGKIFKAMNSSIGDVRGLAKPEIRKRQLAWLKAQMKSSSRGRKGKKAA